MLQRDLSSALSRAKEEMRQNNGAAPLKGKD